MKQPKTFDGVRMKWEIQQRIEEEFAGLAPEQAREEQRRCIERDPQLGPFLKKVRTFSGSPSRTER